MQLYCDTTTPPLSSIFNYITPKLNIQPNHPWTQFNHATPKLNIQPNHPWTQFNHATPKLNIQQPHELNI